MATGWRYAEHTPVDYILLSVTPISINLAKRFYHGDNDDLHPDYEIRTMKT